MIAVLVAAGRTVGRVPVWLRQCGKPIVTRKKDMIVQCTTPARLERVEEKHLDHVNKFTDFISVPVINSKD